MGQSPDENVVEFPTTQTENGTQLREPLTPEQVAQMEEKGATKVLNMIDQNKEYGIKQMQNSVEQSNHRGITSDASAEHAIRVIEKGVGGALTSVEAINSLVDMIRHDMVAIIQNLQQIQQAAVINNTQVNVLLNLLDEKGVINEEDMNRKFRQLQEERAGQEPPKEG